MKRALRHPIEAFRTAPFYLSLVGESVSVTALNAYAAVEQNFPSSGSIGLLGAAAVSLGYAVGASRLAKGKMALRERLETQLETEGFNERVMATTTKEYCTRQAAFVACQNAGFEADYASLCAENAAESQLSWLPHI